MTEYDDGYVYFADHTLGEPIPSHRDLYLAKVVRHLRSANATHILDVGCGTGDFASALAENGFHMSGIDLDPVSIKMANDRRVGSFSEASVYAPLPGTFDGIIAIEVIEHLYSPERFMANAHAALKPGGVLIITTPYWGYLKNVLLAVTNRIDRALTTLWPGGHIKHFSRATLTTLAANSGFRTVAFEGCGLGIRRIPYLWGGMLMVFERL